MWEHQISFKNKNKHSSCYRKKFGNGTWIDLKGSEIRPGENPSCGHGFGVCLPILNLPHDFGNLTHDLWMLGLGNNRFCYSHSCCSVGLESLTTNIFVTAQYNTQHHDNKIELHAEEQGNAFSLENQPKCAPFKISHLHVCLGSRPWTDLNFTPNHKVLILCLYWHLVVLGRKWF